MIKNRYRIGTGFLTTPYILDVLTDYGFVETAYSMAENRERPGWLYQVNNGATTIWESWKGVDEQGRPRYSHNHYAFGAVSSWFFTRVAGISPLEPGFNRIRIKPIPGGSLSHADCHYRSVAGSIQSAWQRDGREFSLRVETPAPSEVHLPDGDIHIVSPGAHRFSCTTR